MIQFDQATKDPLERAPAQPAVQGGSRSLAHLGCVWIAFDDVRGVMVLHSDHWDIAGDLVGDGVVTAQLGRRGRRRQARREIEREVDTA